jgi:hypothetical protein
LALRTSKNEDCGFQNDGSPTREPVEHTVGKRNLTIRLDEVVIEQAKVLVGRRAAGEVRVDKRGGSRRRRGGQIGEGTFSSGQWVL